MARTESSSNLCPNTTHTHTLSHTHTRTHTQGTPTHMLSSVIIVMNGLSRQLALSTICHACDAPSAPLLVRYTAQFEKEKDRDRAEERDTQLLWQGASSWQATAAASRESQEMVNKWKSYADSRRPFSHSLSLCLPSHSFSLSLFPSLLHNYTIKWNLAIQFNALFAVNCAV